MKISCFTGVFVLLILLAGCAPRDALTQNALDGVGARPAPGAKAPLGLRFTDQAGDPLTLGKAIAGRPTVLVFADYTCRYLCGPALVLTAAALDKSSLAPSRDYSFVVIGIDPRDGPMQARAMQQTRLRASRAGSAVRLLSNGPTRTLAAALGYRYLYDARLDQYAHDTSIYIVGADGTVRQLLPEFGLTPKVLANALEEAKGAPAPSALPAPLLFICYCLQPLVGAYDQPAMLALRVGGIGVLLALGFGLAVLWRRRARPS